MRVGDPISYTITITNLGTSVITSPPLTDTYDPNFLTTSVPRPRQRAWTNPMERSSGQNS
ncbi:MAG: hypothetical protein R3A10_16170 [Caldilineaceae bacterium]